MSKIPKVNKAKLKKPPRRQHKNITLPPSHIEYLRVLSERYCFSMSELINMKLEYYLSGRMRDVPLSEILKVQSAHIKQDTLKKIKERSAKLQIPETVLMRNILEYEPPRKEGEYYIWIACKILGVDEKEILRLFPNNQIHNVKKHRVMVDNFINRVNSKDVVCDDSIEEIDTRDLSEEELSKETGEV